jgi:hypothetical protein
MKAQWLRIYPSSVQAFRPLDDCFGDFGSAMKQTWIGGLFDFIRKSE